MSQEKVSGKIQRAFEFYKASADQEYTEAQYELGHCYKKGFGTEINNEKAFNLYMLAAKKGNNKAQKSLAILYEQDAKIKNIEKAVYWYKKAIENGCQDVEESLNNLLSKSSNN